jgi:hypothetical protein
VKVANTSDQVPGDTTNNERFNTLERLYSGSWHDVNAHSNLYNSTTHGDGNWTTDPHFQIWDTRYSSEP